MLRVTEAERVARRGAWRVMKKRGGLDSSLSRGLVTGFFLFRGQAEGGQVNCADSMI